jgi:TrmH family RNA methyltransferase
MGDMQENLRITARDNPSVKHYRRLRDQKKARRTEKLFVAEGLRIVTDALHYPCLVRQLFVTDSAWEKHGELLKPQEFCTLLHISDAVGETMTDTGSTQGIFAVCSMPERPALENVLTGEGRYLVLCQLQDPGNMGMILRTADALGMDGVVGCGSCELYSPKTIRATMGSVFRVPYYEAEDAMALLGLLKQKGIASYAAVPDSSATALSVCAFGDGCAVWIGNEGNGLPTDVIEGCRSAVTIPMKGGPESLNAAMAAGIIMWEMMK